MEARDKLHTLVASSLGKEPTPSCPLNTRLEVYPNFFPPVVLRPSAGHSLLILEVSRSHKTHHTRQDSSRPVISSSQRTLPDNTQHSQQTDIHAQDGIQIHNLSRRAAADLRLRPFGYWDRLSTSEMGENYGNLSNSQQCNHTAKFKIVQVGVLSVCFGDIPLPPLLCLFIA